jgi:hypothetical protein
VADRDVIGAKRDGGPERIACEAERRGGVGGNQDRARTRAAARDRCRGGEQVDRRGRRCVRRDQDPGPARVTRPGLGGITTYSTVLAPVVTVAVLAGPAERPVVVTAGLPSMVTAVEKALAPLGGARAASRTAMALAADAEAPESNGGGAGTAAPVADVAAPDGAVVGAEGLGEPQAATASRETASGSVMAPPRRGHRSRDRRGATVVNRGCRSRRSRSRRSRRSRRAGSRRACPCRRCGRPAGSHPAGPWC